MSSSSAYEVGIDEVIQEIHEQRILARFDYPRKQDGPQIGAIILRLLGCGVVTFVGINPNEAQFKDVAIEIAHNGFYTCTQVWLKLRNEVRGWGSTSKL